MSAVRPNRRWAVHGGASGAVMRRRRAGWSLLVAMGLANSACSGDSGPLCLVQFTRRKIEAEERLRGSAAGVGGSPQ
jgi:hypothetical protein